MTEPHFDPQQLHAFLDGELTAPERAEVERLLTHDPQASAYFAGLKALQGAVVAGLEAEAAKVPEARFEQIWDEIERTLDRDLRLQKAPAPAPSLWARFRGVMRPLFVPVASAAAVAGLVAVLWSGGSGDVATEPASVVASTPAPEQPVLADSSVPAADDAEVVLPAPYGGPAHIQRIDWGVKSGRISEIEGKRNTTTVIWISDDEPSGSERSL